MGEEAEDALMGYTCACGHPQDAGITHNYDGGYCVLHLNLNGEPMNDDPTPNPQTGSQEAKFGDNAGDKVVDPAYAWLMRLREEHWELDKKGMLLAKFIRGETDTQPGKAFRDLPSRDRYLLMQQSAAMAQYFAILSERIFRADNPELREKQDAEIAASEAQASTMPYEDRQ
jgi:hypothetical protein